MLTFWDRQPEIEAIRRLDDNQRVLNFHGEHGIGKTRLLLEGAAALRDTQRAFVFEVDFKCLEQHRESRPREMLHQLVTNARVPLPVPWGDPIAGAEKIVDRLGEYRNTGRVALMVDTTEAVQEDVDFWQWFEDYMLCPLLVGEGEMQVVLAGRLPAPIRSPGVRRYLKVQPLTPLPAEDEARRLVQEMLAKEGLDDNQVERLTDLVLEFSHGHPLLSQSVTRYLIPLANQELTDLLRSRVAEEIVGRFIDEAFFRFEPAMSRWVPLMKWASVLDWFDATVFYPFDVAMSGSRQPEIEWQHDFRKAMAQLRSPYAVTKWEGAGYALVGTVKSIVASYLRAARHAEYTQALKVAAEVFSGIAEEYFGNDPQAGEPYREASKRYQQRLDMEIQYGTAKQRQ